MAGRTSDRLRQHAALKIEDPSREIAGFPHRGRKGGADHCLRLFFDDGDQPIPHDLPPNSGKLLAGLASHAVSRVNSIYPSAVKRPRQPALRTVVVSSSVTMAGPEK